MNPSQLFEANTEGAFTIPQATYFAAPGVSNSMLSNIVPTPAHLRAYLDDPDDREETPAMFLGSMVHQAILEPDRPLPRLDIKPEGMKFSTITGKQWRDARVNAGIHIVTHEEYSKLLGCVRSASKHPFIADVLGAETMTEVSVFSRVNGSIMRKARIDAVPPGNFLGDFKTTADASPEGFRKALADRGYARQAAWYLDIWNHLFPEDHKDTFCFFALETKPPFLAAVYQLTTHAIETARDQILTRFESYRRCVESGEWPGYPDTPQLISLPPWAK